MKLSSTTIVLLFTSLFASTIASATATTTPAVTATATSSSGSATIVSPHKGDRNLLRSLSATESAEGEDNDEHIIVSDDSLVTLSSFLVIEISGDHIHDDIHMDINESLKDRADFLYAFQQAFDTIHGDKDGLYLSGEQIDGIHHVDVHVYDHHQSKDKDDNDERSSPKWDVYLHADIAGLCKFCRDDDDTSVSDYVFQEKFLNAVADQFCLQLIAIVDDDGYDEQERWSQQRFQQQQQQDEDPQDDREDETDATRCDIYVLSEYDYATALDATATGSSSNDSGSSIASSSSLSSVLPTDASLSSSEAHESTSASPVTLPYYFNGGVKKIGYDGDGGNTNNNNGIVGTANLKVTLHGTSMQDRSASSKNKDSTSSCGVWHNDDLFDFGTSFRNGFNSIHGVSDGLYDAGQTIDRIRCVRTKGSISSNRSEYVYDEDGNDKRSESNHDDVPAKSSSSSTTASTTTTTTIVDRNHVPSVSFRRNKKKRRYKPKSQVYDWRAQSDLYFRMDLSARCRFCPDDDDTDAGVTSSVSAATSTTGTTTKTTTMINAAKNDENDDDGIVAGAFSEASLYDIADALCDDLIRYANPNFRTVFDCEIEYLSEDEYDQALLLPSSSTSTANTDSDSDDHDKVREDTSSQDRVKVEDDGRVFYASIK